MWMDGRLGVVDGELASANQNPGPCARLDGANDELDNPVTSRQ